MPVPHCNLNSLGFMIIRTSLRFLSAWEILAYLVIFLTAHAAAAEPAKPEIPMAAKIRELIEKSATALDALRRQLHP